MNKFKTGDKVRVVKYGHLFWENKDGKVKYFDMSPELVRKEGWITECSKTGGYALEFTDGNRNSWFNDDNLELIHKRQ